MKEDSMNKTVSGATISDKAGHIDKRLVFEYLTEEEIWQEISSCRDAVTMLSGPKNKVANLAEKIVLESEFPISMCELWHEMGDHPDAANIERIEPHHKYKARFAWYIKHRIKNPVTMVRQNGVVKYFRDDR